MEIFPADPQSRRRRNDEDYKTLTIWLSRTKLRTKERNFLRIIQITIAYSRHCDSYRLICQFQRGHQDPFIDTVSAICSNNWLKAVCFRVGGRTIILLSFFFLYYNRYYYYYFFIIITIIIIINKRSFTFLLSLLNKYCVTGNAAFFCLPLVTPMQHCFFCF